MERMSNEQFAALLSVYGEAYMHGDAKMIHETRTAVLDAYAQAVAERDELNRDCDVAMRAAQAWRVRHAAAVRAGGAVKVPDEPDAWLFRGKGDGEGAAFATVCPPDECTQHYPLERWTRGYTFTPLYTHPPAEAATWQPIHCVNLNLPNEGDTVLIYDRAWGVKITEFDTWSEQPAGPLVGGSVTFGPWFLDYDDVTHWMPLPEPPRAVLSGRKEGNANEPR